MLCPCPYMEANDDSYHMPVWIGIGISSGIGISIGIRISIGKVSSSVLSIESTV